MKERLVVAFVTVLIFSAGLGTGIWADRLKPMPPPPIQFMGEFAGNRGFPPGAPSRGPVDRAQLVAEIERLGPEIKVYNAHLLLIEAEFEHDLQNVLTPDQKTARAGILKRRGEAFSAMVRRLEGQPMTDQEIERLQQPSIRLFRVVVLTTELDDLVRDLKLTDSERPIVLELLRQRRQKFLALVDSVPPPSIMLSRLATQIRRLDHPKP